MVSPVRPRSCLSLSFFSLSVLSGCSPLSQDHAFSRSLARLLILSLGILSLSFSLLVF